MRIFVFADFANSSRRRLLRPAVGFMDNEPALGPSRAAASLEGSALRPHRRCDAPRASRARAGECQESCVGLDGGADRHLHAMVASLAASVRSLKPTAHVYRGTETPMFAIWRLGDDPFNRYRVNAGTDGCHI
jgi:hypothetical protein